MVHPEDPLRSTTYSDVTQAEELLVPVIRSGVCVYDPPPLSQVRERTLLQLEELDASHNRFLNPHTYKVGVERGLSERRMALIAEARTHTEE
jgi:nicotinate phosphoribosyltransferase